MRGALIIVAACLGAACGVPPSPADAGDAGRTDGGRADGGQDAGADGGWDAGDGGPGDAGWCGAGEACFSLADGGRVAGLAIAAFDHRGWWWTPSATDTWVLWPASASLSQVGALRFVSAPRDGQVVQAARPWAVPPAYRDAMADAGLVLGRLPLDGVAQVIMGHAGYHLQEDGYGDWAWDFVRTAPDGGRWRTLGLTNDDYLVWDEPVVLPTAGTVVEVVSGAPDNAPGGYDAGAPNNLVGVHLGGSFSLYLLHFRQGSIPRRDAGTCAPAVPGVPCVEVGEPLPAGAFLGRVGNSGVSLEPHLHVTLLAWDDAHARFWSVPSEVVGYWQSGTGADAGFAGRGDPATGDSVSPSPF